MAELEPFVGRVRERIKKNANAALWPLLERHWADLVGACRAEAQEFRNGSPMPRWHVRACHEVLKLAEHTSARRIIETFTALYLLADFDPHRFKSDDAFLFQLTRRLRGLTDVNAGTYWDESSRRVKRVYRDLPPRTAVQFARMLNQALGSVGLHFAKLEREDDRRRREAASEMNAALLALQ